MSKARVLVLTAAGKTGLHIALRLRHEGHPVTAFVRRLDARSERLRAAGADLVVGSLTDLDDMRRAMHGAQRAYFNTPMEPGHLRAAAVFAAAAAEAGLQQVVALSQWLASPQHPSLHSREVWLADQLLARLPHTALTTINVGFFADNDLQPLLFTAQFGLLMLPYGAGLNAPPSNEDIAAVCAEILTRPQGHAGQRYRPTGPRLLSPQDIAATLSRVLNRRVRYVNAPLGVMSRVMSGMGFSTYFIAQFQQYAQEYRRGAFAVGAPNDVVRRITGRDPESFETVARRYAAALAQARPSLTAQIGLLARLSAWMLRAAPKVAPHLARTDFSQPDHARLSSDSAEWRQAHPQAAQPVSPGAEGKASRDAQAEDGIIAPA